MALPWAKVERPTATLVGACLALFMAGTSVLAADPELEAIVRVKELLAARGHKIAAVVILNKWPATAPSQEAFAIDGRIYVNARSQILRAAARSRAYDVLLASLVLHEQAHLGGANEQEALEAELGWLIAERADKEFIQETRRALDDERQKARPPRRGRAAAEYQNRDAVRLLLDHRADVNARAAVDGADVGGRPPFFTP